MFQEVKVECSVSSNRIQARSLFSLSSRALTYADCDQNPECVPSSIIFYSNNCSEWQLLLLVFGKAIFCSAVCYF